MGADFEGPVQDPIGREAPGFGSAGLPGLRAVDSFKANFHHAVRPGADPDGVAVGDAQSLGLEAGARPRHIPGRPAPADREEQRHQDGGHPDSPPGGGGSGPGGVWIRKRCRGVGVVGNRPALGCGPSPALQHLVGGQSGQDREDEPCCQPPRGCLRRRQAGPLQAQGGVDFGRAPREEEDGGHQEEAHGLGPAGAREGGDQAQEAGRSQQHHAPGTRGPGDQQDQEDQGGPVQPARVQVVDQPGQPQAVASQQLVADQPRSQHGQPQRQELAPAGLGEEGLQGRGGSASRTRQERQGGDAEQGIGEVDGGDHHQVAAPGGLGLGPAPAQRGQSRRVACAQAGQEPHGHPAQEARQGRTPRDVGGLGSLVLSRQAGAGIPQGQQQAGRAEEPRQSRKERPEGGPFAWEQGAGEDDQAQQPAGHEDDQGPAAPLVGHDEEKRNPRQQPAHPGTQQAIQGRGERKAPGLQCQESGDHGNPQDQSPHRAGHGVAQGLQASSPADQAMGGQKGVGLVGWDAEEERGHRLEESVGHCSRHDADGRRQGGQPQARPDGGRSGQKRGRDVHVQARGQAAQDAGGHSHQEGQHQGQRLHLRYPPRRIGPPGKAALCSGRSAPRSAGPGPTPGGADPGGLPRSRT